MQPGISGRERDRRPTAKLPSPPRRQSSRRWSICGLALCLGLLLAARPERDHSLAVAQERAEGDATLFMPPDRKALQNLRNAQELLGEERFSEAVRLLGGVLEGPEDYFLPPERPKATAKPGDVQPVAQRVARSLKSEAQHLIGQMPAGGREAYELQFGNEAKRLLDSAAREGRLAGLAEVSRRFFHTEAGQDATELLATCLLERGQPLAAALSFQRLADAPRRANYEPALSLKWSLALARSGQRTAALDVLRHFTKVGTKSIALDGRTIATNDELAMGAWLDRHAMAKPEGIVERDDPWLMYRGNAARNAISSGDTPLLNRRWAVPTVYNPEPRKLDLERIIEQRRQTQADQGEALLPAAVPLAVNDHIVMRTMLGTTAVNFRTGKRVWFQDDGIVRQTLDKFAQESSGATKTSSGGNDNATTLPSWLEHRLWNDAVYGTKSSDLNYVFCIEDLKLDDQPDFRRTVMNNGRMAQKDLHPSNRLVAYGFARQGALECTTYDVPELRDAFFLGPPLPLEGRYYAILEYKGEIRLAVLKIITERTTVDARTGKTKDHHRFEVDWSQQLAAPERTTLDDPARRFAGATPSYVDGVLVCPTSAGAIVAVDLPTRSLRWGYTYPRNDLFPMRQGMAFINGRMVKQQSDTDRWVDSSLTLAANRVLATPIETQKLMCLNLLDGQLVL